MEMPKVVKTDTTSPSWGAGLGAKFLLLVVAWFVVSVSLVLTARRRYRRVRKTPTSD